MRKHFWIFIIIAIVLLATGNIGAQDGLDLPTELYILLNDGTVACAGSAQQVIRKEILEQVYGTQVTVQINSSSGRPHVMLGRHEGY